LDRPGDFIPADLVLSAWHGVAAARHACMCLSLAASPPAAECETWRFSRAPTCEMGVQILELRHALARAGRSRSRGSVTDQRLLRGGRAPLAVGRGLFAGVGMGERWCERLL